MIPEGRRRWAQTMVVLSLPLATVATIVLASGPSDPVQFHLIHTVRPPRVLLAALSGATLAVAGAVMEAVFRNPLAEPDITRETSLAITNAPSAEDTQQARQL